MRKALNRFRLFLLRHLGGVDAVTHQMTVATQVRKAHERIATLAYRYAMNDAIEAVAREQADQVARMLRRVFNGEAPAVEMKIADPDRPDVVLTGSQDGYSAYTLRLPVLNYRFMVKEPREVKTWRD